jgi:hypothetical protein
MPALLVQMEGPHGSLVLAGDTGHTAGRVWLPSGAMTSLIWDRRPDEVPAAQRKRP